MCTCLKKMTTDRPKETPPMTMNKTRQSQSYTRLLETVCFLEQIPSADKYPSVFWCQMEAQEYAQGDARGCNYNVNIISKRQVLRSVVVSMYY